MKTIPYLKRLFLFLTFLCLVLEGIAQQLLPPSQLSFKRLTVDQGLSQGINLFIFKDSQGFVWISSAAGLNRYDGNEIKVYREINGDSTSLKGANVIGRFCEDEQHNIWFSTFDAVNCYHRQSDQFMSFNLRDSVGAEVVDYFTCGLDKEGQLWLVHDNDLYKLNINTKRFTFVEKQSKIFQKGKIQCDAKGKIKRIFFYSGPNNEGVQVVEFKEYNKPESTIFFAKESKYINSLGIEIKELVVENDSVLWLATSDGLIEFNINNKRFETYSSFFQNGKQSGPLSIKGVDQYDENYLILATKDHGIGFFDKQLKSFVQFYEKTEGVDYSIANNNVSMVYTDPDQGVWADIYGFSVEYASPKKIKFKNYLLETTQKNKGFGRYIFELPDGNTWVGTHSNGNYILNEDNEIVDLIDNRTHPELENSRIAYQFLDKHNRVWMLDWQQKLYYYDLLTKKIHAVSYGEGIVPQTLLYGLNLKNGSIIFSAYKGGLYKVKEEHAEGPIIVPIEGFDSKLPIPSFFQAEDGLVYANENLSQMIVFDENFRIKKRIPSAALYFSYYEQPGDSILWIGTDKGLIRYNKKTEKFHYPPSSSNFMIYGIVPDKDYLWLSTNKGLLRFHQFDFTVKSFNIFDGISFSEYTRFSSIKKKDGEIIFGSLNGLTTFHGENIQLLPNLTQPQITDIKINDEIYPGLSCADSINVTNVSEIKALQLEYNENTISFEFSAMDYGDASQNEYQYKMVGVDDNWIKAGNKNFARYPNLPGGHYEFQLKATNSDGSWNKDPRIIKIEVIPLLIHRRWFQGLLGLIALGIILFSFRSWQKIKYDKQLASEQQKLALEQQKLFWAKKMHDDLGADYSSLKLRIGMLAAKLNNNADASIKKDTNRLIEISDFISKQIRGITWSLNFKNDSLDKLINFLQEYSTKLFEDTDTNIEFPLPDDIPQKEILGEVRMTVLHVFKEVLNNAQKHAKADDITVEVRNTLKDTTIIINDNGIGFDPQLLKKSTGNGLMNIQNRMDEINGSAEIKTSPSGTTVRLFFPI